jgi:GH24 family phage-related lysozyme (muramidase)
MMISLKKILKEAMDAQPPAIVRSSEHFSPKFIDYIKSVENAAKIGYRNGTWFWHKAPEGGMPEIGYGHKIKKGEEGKFSKGVSNSEIEQLLRKDLAVAKKQVYNDIKHMFNVQVPLTPLQEEILTDYAYNLGNLRGYPKFVKAVVNQDWNTAKKEYIRSYTDDKGKTQTLARNKIFFDTFLKDLKTK